LACQADPAQFGLLRTSPAFCDARIDAAQISFALRMLDLRGFSAVAASDRSRRLAAMAIPSANAISQRTIDRF
jgi:hypothetical protein